MGSGASKVLWRDERTLLVQTGKKYASTIDGEVQEWCECDLDRLLESTETQRNFQADAYKDAIKRFETALRSDDAPGMALASHDSEVAFELIQKADLATRLLDIASDARRK